MGATVVASATVTNATATVTKSGADRVGVS